MTQFVDLRVVDSDQNHDSSRVPLTTNQMESLEKNNESILSGDKVKVVGPEGEFKGIAWPDDSYNGDIPLSPKQKSDIGVMNGSKVRVYPAGTHSDDIYSQNSTKNQSKYNVPNSSDETDSKEDGLNVFDDISYDDVGGLDEELTDIRQMVELPLKRPDLFKEVGVEPPKGVLMHGPPGTGKTLIAKAIANETNARFTKIDGPEIMSKYTGETEKRLRKIFKDARESGTAIIFFDEIDSLGTDRNDSNDTENRLVGQMLSLMDGLESDENVIVIGATNRVDSLDPALRRSGRFDREILIGAPNEIGRKEILEIHTSDMPLSEDVSLTALAEQTTGFVGADLAALSREAALKSIQNSFDGENITVDDIINGKVEDIKVTMEEFNHAMSNVDPSALRSLATNTPTVTYDDVGGLDTVKRRMEEIVAWPLNRPKLFNETNTSSPSGVLLHGPEGVGKTLIAKSTGGEFDVNFTRVNSSSIFQKYVGESEDQVKDIFQKAERASPVIIFFEQLDAIAGYNSDNSGAQERVISQLLIELDRIQNDPTITVIGEVNDADSIDSRLTQSGRIDELIEIPEPDGKTRRKIFEKIVSKKKLDEDISIGEIVSQLDDKSASGSDIESIVRNASLKSIREHTKKYGDESESNAEEIVLTQNHFEEAIDSYLD